MRRALLLAAGVWLCSGSAAVRASTPAADLSVRTTLYHFYPAPPIPPPQPGSVQTLPSAYFTFAVADNGPDSADNVVLSVATPGLAPDGSGFGPSPLLPMQLNGIQPGISCSAAPGGLSCPIGPLDAGSGADLSFFAQGAVQAGASYVATASLSGLVGGSCPLPGCDSDPANNSSTHTVVASDVALPAGSLHGARWV